MDICLSLPKDFSLKNYHSSFSALIYFILPPVLPYSTLSYFIEAARPSVRAYTIYDPDARKAQMRARSRSSLHRRHHFRNRRTRRWTLSTSLSSSGSLFTNSASSSVSVAFHHLLFLVMGDQIIAYRVWDVFVDREPVVTCIDSL